MYNQYSLLNYFFNSNLKCYCTYPVHGDMYNIHTP